MANKPIIGIEATEAEMAAYRARLAQRLPGSQFSLKWKPLVLAAAAAILIFVLVPSMDKNEFNNLDLACLESLAGSPSPEMMARAQELLQDKPSIARSNAIMFLCMTEDPANGTRLAAKGVQEDPRSEFRFFYLEYLLDKADEYSFNAARIEQLMDSESDEACLSLFKSLLRITI